MNRSTQSAETYLSAPDNCQLQHIPGIRGLPYIGNAIKLVTDMPEFVKTMYETYGPVSRMDGVDQTVLLLVGPDLYQQVLLDKEKNFSSRMGYDKQLATMYPNSMLLTDFDEHRISRRMFQTAFKNDAMRGYHQVVNQVMVAAMAELKQNPQINFVEFIKALLLKNAAKVFIGMEDISSDEYRLLNKAFEDASHGTAALVRKEWPLTAFKRGKDGVRYMRSYFSELIKQRRQQPSVDMFSHICNERNDDGQLYSEEEILNQMTFLLFAAHDTSASVLSNMIYHTTQESVWQERIRQECQSLQSDTLAFAQLSELSLLDMVFKETLRLQPAVPLMARRTIRDCSLAGHFVPANTVLFIPPTYNHRLPEYWSNPDQFDPLRFSPERAEHKNHSFCYVPFGGGAHKCIGMHFADMIVKTFMYHFLRNFQYHTKPGYDPKMRYVPLPKPADGIPLTLKPITV